MNDLSELAAGLMPVAARAGEAILRIYRDGFTVERKQDDSPVTLADLESQRIILEELQRLTPGVPVLSEESAHAPWPERRDWRRLWIVDPLDGTREFIKRNGEFTINIALVIDNEPVLGLIAAPAQRLLYWGAVGCGAFVRRGEMPWAAIRVAQLRNPPRIVCSRSHASPSTAAYLERLGRHEMIGMGSSLKFGLVAAGEADLYPRFGPTSEWDTAAGQALLEAAGGHVTRLDGHRLRYNCRESLLNGDFLAYGDPRVLETTDT